MRGPYPREGDPGCAHHPWGPRVPPLLHSPRAGGPGSTRPAEPVDGRDPACRGPGAGFVHGFQRVSLGSGRDQSWVPRSALLLPGSWGGKGRGEGKGGGGGVARRRDCFPIVFCPTSAREPVFFAPRPVALPSLLLCSTFRRQNPLPWRGGGKIKIKKIKTNKNIPLSPPSLPPLRPKTVNTASRVLLVLVRDAVWEGGKEESPPFPAGTCQHNGDMSPKGALPGDRNKAAPPKPPLAAGSPAGPGGWGLWVTAELNTWFSEGFGGLLPSIS